ncbi:hypothetical protein C8R46DRAFT_1186798 [Mycena filopes]|nr:hypothetical protein C8R46DRAFT_1186798 [Mycena filopes]
MPRISPLPAAALVALQWLLRANAQGDFCGDDSCNGNPHTRSQTSSGARPSGSSVILNKGSSTKQSTVIALAVVLSVVVLLALAFLLWWQVRRRRHREYTGTQPYIDGIPSGAPAQMHEVPIEPAPPYVLPAVEPFPLEAPASGNLRGKSLDDGMVETRGAGVVPPSYPVMEG